MTRFDGVGGLVVAMQRLLSDVCDRHRERRAKMAVVIERMMVEALGHEGDWRCSEDSFKEKSSSGLTCL